MYMINDVLVNKILEKYIHWHNSSENKFKFKYICLINLLMTSEGYSLAFIFLYKSKAKSKNKYFIFKVDILLKVCSSSNFCRLKIPSFKFRSLLSLLY